METVVGVRFKKLGKIYYYGTKNLNLKIGQSVIVHTDLGVECGKIVMEPHTAKMEMEKAEAPRKTVIRVAIDRDIENTENNAKKEKEAFEMFCKKIKEHKLEMKPVEVKFAFDRSKITFYFTADGRVDFRDLVKNLASIYRTRIELRQIGVRDQAKNLGGIAICGQSFCCSTFLDDFHPVSIKMAKEQNLSLNPVKLSGSCGRLMCCLKYEQDSYEELLKTTPVVGSYVETEDGNGTVIDVNIITGNTRVRLEAKDILAPKYYHKSNIKILKSAKTQGIKPELDYLKKLEK